MFFFCPSWIVVALSELGSDLHSCCAPLLQEEMWAKASTPSLQGAVNVCIGIWEVAEVDASERARSRVNEYWVASPFTAAMTHRRIRCGGDVSWHVFQGWQVRRGVPSIDYPMRWSSPSLYVGFSVIFVLDIRRCITTSNPRVGASSVRRQS